MLRILTVFLLLTIVAISIAESPRNELLRNKRSPIVDLVNKVKPAIVVIWGTSKSDDVQKQKNVPLGLGAIIDKAGVIVTPRHVVEGKEALETILADGRKLFAKVALSDADSGLAIIKVVSSKPLPCAKLADSGMAQIGDSVVGFGFVYKEIRVISATDRKIKGKKEIFLQTDTSIGPGSTSDMLVNLEGEIIGIDIGTGNRAVGLALPSNRVKEIVAQSAKKK